VTHSSHGPRLLSFMFGPGGHVVSNVQARLIASSLALVAAAIFWHAQPQISAGPGAAFLAGALFVVEYIRASIPDRGHRAEPRAAPDAGR
jgi:hypothetical protein